LVDTAVKLQERSLSKSGCSILQTIAYFDIFDYPLLAREVSKFCGQLLDEDQVEVVIKDLISSGAVFKLDEFYSLRKDYLLAENRKKGNDKAVLLFPKAFSAGRFLYKFPFVRGVAISGSLSKNFADDKGDIDFFILTKSDRLWIARTFMHLFKKLTYIFGREHSFCMNYYLDETALEIQEKNIYTAMEIKTLVPVSGSAAIAVFFESNQWTSSLLPNLPTPGEGISDNRSIFKAFFEWLFDNRLGNKLDNYLFRLTTRRWLKKEISGKKNMKGRVMNLLTSRHYARSNPDFYQERIIGKYNAKVSELKKKWPQFF
jgi:hypothetical protein